MNPAHKNQRTVTLNSTNGWTRTFENLPAYNAAGQKYTYYAKELSVGGVPIGDGYDVAYDNGNGVTHIKNFGGDNQEDYVRVIGAKTWVDNGLHPEERGVVLQLLRTTTPSDETSWETVPETEYILRWYNRDSNVWNYSFEGLPRRDAETTSLYLPRCGADYGR